MTTARTSAARLAAALLITACTPAAPAKRSPVVAPAASAAPLPAAPAAGPTFAPWDGLYVLTGTDAGAGQPAAWVRTLTKGVSIAIGPYVTTFTGTPGPAGLRTTVTDDGESHVMTLAPPPSQAGAPWRIAFEGTSFGYEQHVEPLEAIARERLIVGQRFARIDQQSLTPTGPLDAAKTHDVLTVLPRGLVRTELPDTPRALGCFVDALVPMSSEEGVPLAAPLPAPGALGVVRYIMPKVKEDCDDVDPDAPAHGVDGGAFLFVSRDGRIPGLLMQSYMYSELFVAPDCTRGDVAMMMRAAEEALAHQAE